MVQNGCTGIISLPGGMVRWLMSSRYWPLLKLQYVQCGGGCVATRSGHSASTARPPTVKLVAMAAVEVLKLYLASGMVPFAMTPPDGQYRPC